MNRRDFLHASAAAGATAATLAAAAPQAHAGDPPRTYRAGVIGTGWYGMVDLRHLMSEPNVEVVSLCDVDSRMVREAADEVEKRTQRRPQTFGDFRDMLKPRNVDVVIVGTPDHWHALPAIAAMEAGADVYLEKPICHTYLEGRALLRTARRLNRVVQINTQRRSTPHIRTARDFVRAGNLGRVGVARAFCYYAMRGNDNPPNEQPPKSLNYDFWVGPAPMIPFNPLMHPKGWRKFNEFSNGILGDMGVHMLDVVRWCLDLRYPRRVSSTGGIFVERQGRANITDTQTVTYDYGDQTVIWEHRTYGRYDQPNVGWGINFYGERGTLQVTLDYWEFRPNGNGKPRREEARVEKSPNAQLEPDNIVPAGRAHMRNFMECVRSRQRPVADVEEGHISTALCVLGTVSQQVGRSITWDADKEVCVGDEEATRHLRREYRKPWTYPQG
jgi:predicted dehydrogenase